MHIASCYFVNYIQWTSDQKKFSNAVMITTATRFGSYGCPLIVKINILGRSLEWSYASAVNFLSGTIAKVVKVKGMLRSPPKGCNCTVKCRRLKLSASGCCEICS